MPDERSMLFVAGRSVRQLVFSNLRDRVVYRVPDGFERGEGFAAAEDGVNATLVERQNDSYRLRLIATARGTATTVTEAGEPISHAVPRPRRAGILYRRAGGLWLVNYDGQQNHRLRTEPGGIAAPIWSADGRTVFYLNIPEEAGKLNTLREHTPDSNADQFVSKTSQFVNFARNRDASVFAGASSNKSSPYLLLLLRVTHREFTLCEHRSSDPAAVAPVFSPSSQRIYFQSDRHGKPAIYAISVDKLVERTES